MSEENYRSEIDDFQTHYQYDCSYMREMLEYIPKAYGKFDDFMPLATHRDQLSANSYWVAKIAAMQVEDCGACLQLNVRMALENGVSRDTIRACLDKGEGLSTGLRDIYDFSVSVASNGPLQTELKERVAQSLSKAELLELALSIATVRVFPAIKRTLGYAESCSLVEIAL